MRNNCRIHWAMLGDDSCYLMLIAKELIIYLLFCLSIKKSMWQMEFLTSTLSCLY